MCDAICFSNSLVTPISHFLTEVISRCVSRARKIAHASIRERAEGVSALIQVVASAEGRQHLMFIAYPITHAPLPHPAGQATCAPLALLSGRRAEPPSSSMCVPRQVAFLL